MNKKEILYCDLDGVVADYELAKGKKTKEETREKGFFENIPAIEGSVEALTKIMEKYDVYFLSTAPWSNIHSWTEKRVWVEKHFGDNAFKKLILSHNKGLLKGRYLIDDRIANGVDNFEGEHIHFGSDKFKSWNDVLEYLNINK